MKIGLIVIKYFAFMPILLFFDILYFRGYEKIYLYMMWLSILYVVLMAILDYWAFKSLAKESFSMNFNQIELNELTIELNKSRDNILTLTEQILHLDHEVEKNKRESISIREIYDEMTEAYRDTVLLFVDLIDIEGKFTKSHSKQVIEIVSEIGGGMDITTKELEILKYSAILNDIGKLGALEESVNTRGDLSADELKECKQNPILAHHLEAGIEFLKSCAQVTLEQFDCGERWTKTYGFDARKTKKLSSVLAIANAIVAMINDRPDRKEIKITEAITEIESVTGNQIDPEMENILIEMMNGSKGIISMLRKT